MMQQQKCKTVITLIVAVLLCFVPLLGIQADVSALSSSQLKSELEVLQDQADEIAAEAERLQDEIAENESETKSFVDRKVEIDRQISLTQRQLENLNSQIQQYNLLIAAKQEELEAAETQEESLNEQYKIRLRAMEENGGVSYWSVLFQASSFTDLLDRINMISEVAASDQAMLREIKAVAEEIAAAQEEIQENRTDLETAKAGQEALEAQLSQQRAESDAMIAELAANRAELLEVSLTYDQMEEQVRRQILETQTAYEDALADEEAQRRIEAARDQAAGGSTGNPSGSASSGFLYPLSVSGSITDAYGYRWHPIYQAYRFHYGVDFAVPYGTLIYASKSGTVTAAAYNTYNGNYVTLNHNDGYATLYAHMSNYIVSVGEYVNQGDVIGYVGTTGVSTGPHLHFEVYYGGVNVNPMEYVSIP